VPRRSGDRKQNRPHRTVIDAVGCGAAGRGPEESTDEVDGQIKSGGRPATGEQVTVVNDPSFRVNASTRGREVIQRNAIRHRPAPREQSGCREQHRTGADRREHRALGVHHGQSRGQLSVVDQVTHTAVVVAPTAPRDDDQLSCLVELIGDLDHQPVSCVDGDGMTSGPYCLCGQPRASQYLERPDRIEVVDTIKKQDLGVGSRCWHGSTMP